jgi:hypothetical protein
MLLQLHEPGESPAPHESERAWRSASTPGTNPVALA